MLEYIYFSIYYFILFSDYCVALVVPNPSHLEAIAVRLGLPSNAEFETLCADPQIEKAVLAELAEHGKKCKYRWLLNINKKVLFLFKRFC